MPDNNTTGTYPKSEMVRARIVEEVRQGRFVGQDVLPGERDLAVALGVSRTTLRRAIADLVRSGFLGQRQGYGTFVRRPDLERSKPGLKKNPPLCVHGPGDELLASGIASDCVNNTTGLFRPKPSEAMALDLIPGGRIWRACRTLIDGEGAPFALETIAVAETSLNGAAARPDELLLRLDQCGLTIHRSRRRLRYTSLEGNEMRLLAAKENTTGILSEQHGFSTDGRARIVWLMVQRLDSFDIAFDVTLMG